MPEYRRSLIPGGTFFFTLVTNHRRKIFHDPNARRMLREAFRYAEEKVGPFQIDAICLLPDHLHCIWTLPQNDYNYSTRWKVIKAGFSRQYLHELKLAISLSPSKIEKGEAGLWQRRFWEHTIRDEDDLNRHIEYIHYNPVKHGLVEEVKAWPWSSFHRFVQEGIFDENWGSNHPDFGDLAVIE